MKQIFTTATFLLLLAVSLQTKAQGIYQFWGGTVNGGPDGRGTIFTTKFDGTGQRMVNDFAYDRPGKPDSKNVPVAYNNKLYTVTYEGGTQGDGIIVEFNPADNSYIRRADMTTIGGSQTGSAMIVYNNKLYGTSHGGANGDGVLFEFDPATGSLTKKYDFNETTGQYPSGGLVVYNNRFYGVTQMGGTEDVGVLFEFNPANNVYTVRHHFSDAGITGIYPRAGLVVYNNLLWGTTDQNTTMGFSGSLYSFNPANNVLTVKRNFADISLGAVQTTMTVFNNKLYGTPAFGGGFSNLGCIFEYNPANNGLAIVHNFTATTATGDALLVPYDSKLYGISFTGGAAGDGVIFTYEPATDIYATKMNLSNTSGHHGLGLMLYNNKMYSWAKFGGLYDQGTFIEYNPVANGYIKKIDLGDNNMSASSGSMIYYNSKVYGLAYNTGNGGIYEIDPVTNEFTEKFLFNGTNGSIVYGGTMMLYNNKIYGTTNRGGTNDEGTIFEYDPATNILITRHSFHHTTGRYPRGKMIAYNNKLYGTTSSGSTNGDGNIYQFDPATGIYTEKVIMSPTFGIEPVAALTLYNNKFYGTTKYGGTNGDGTLFEFDPAINGFAVRANFNAATTGSSGVARMVAYNGMLYGTTVEDMTFASTLFQFNPVTYALTKKHDFVVATGTYSASGLTVMNKKLYGLATRGGTYNKGTIYEYDPSNNAVNSKHNFNGFNGSFPLYNELVPIPAKTAPGNPGSCANANSANINATNNNDWIQFTDQYGEAVAEINANGNNLGNVTVNYYVHNAAVRVDPNGKPYLDRNITISVQNQPATDVSVRLYIRRTELDALKNTPGSGVNTFGDLAIFKNNDACSYELSAAATKQATFIAAWREDYVLSTSVSSFSSFYFASRFTNTLPVHVLSFTGAKEASSNKLNWTASCTNKVDFTVERSTDGINFSSIGIVQAVMQDCNHPFNFNDVNVSNGKYYYRLKMDELNGSISYSKTILINRTKDDYTDIKIVPNPVSGSTANLQVAISQKQTFQFMITDVSGRKVLQQTAQFAAGSSEYKLDVRNLGSGVYYLNYINEEGERTTVKFVKQ